MGIWKDASVRGGAKDAVAFFRQSRGPRLVPLLLALLMPGIIVTIFIVDSRINTAPTPRQEVTYFESWLTDRTDAEILADRWQVECLKDKAATKRKDNMKALARVSGMDPEAIEAEIEEERIARGEEFPEPLPDGVTC